jgi:hypothetical protein
MFKYKIGDIVGLKATWGEDIPLSMISPHVHYFHHFLIGPCIPEDDDWIILESINSGVRVGRLSWYDGREAVVYRPTLETAGELAFDQATLYGRRGYDYLQLAKLFIWGIPKWVNGGFKPIPWNKIPSDSDAALICTELCVRSYDKVWRLVSSGVAATPAAIWQACILGKLSIVDEGPIEAGIPKKRSILYELIIALIIMTCKLGFKVLSTWIIAILRKVQSWLLRWTGAGSTSK